MFGKRIATFHLIPLKFYIMIWVPIQIPVRSNPKEFFLILYSQHMTMKKILFFYYKMVKK
jgi:hypothetical protein